MSEIKILSQNLINQIAAGEVIERPASVIKELMENSIDAGSTCIDVKIQDAGKSLISVSDNGCGMDKESLQKCILSHATSKLSDENLFDIHTFGFRGEALPSIVSIARVSITSSVDNSGEAYMLSAENGGVQEITIAMREKGTSIEIRDLFFATPARLKFLKSDESESSSCLAVFNRIALACPHIQVSFFDGNKKKVEYKLTDQLQTRVRDIFGKDFIENVFEIDIKRDNFRLRGFLGVPTFNKATSNYQYFFINNRFVKDKIFAAALKVAYLGLIPQGRFAVAVLFLDLPFNEVDVNAHPAKTEVRFKDSEKVRRFLTSELKKAVVTCGSSKAASNFDGITTNSVSEINENVFQERAPIISDNVKPLKSEVHLPESFNFSKNINRSHQTFEKSYAAPIFQPHKFNNMRLMDSENEKTVQYLASSLEKSVPTYSESLSQTPKVNLGTPIYQLDNKYILAVADDNLVIVDQHAAAERITLEKLKADTNLDSQDLLLPEVCNLSAEAVELFEKNIDLLHKFGIFYDKLSEDMIVINSLPSILGPCNARALINDVADELSLFGNVNSLEEKIHLILSTISCHGSLRAGKKLAPEEMDCLLRKMENTQNIAQCCHGRPSYIILSSKNLNKLFERS